MKTIYIIILIILLPWFVHGQEEIPVQINWNGIDRQKTIKDIEIHTISFENSTNVSQFGALPVYSVETDLPSAHFVCDFQFEIQDADTLSKIESSGLTDADLLQNDLLCHVKYNGLKATLYVVPMKRDHIAKHIHLIT